MGIEPSVAAERRLRLTILSSRDAHLRRSLLPLIAGTFMPGELSNVVFESDRGGTFGCPGATRLTPDRDLVASWSDARTAMLPMLTDASPEIPAFADQLAPVARGVVETDTIAADLLAAASRQARALALVLEAHAIGATTLPEPVLRAVREASALLPAVFAPATDAALQPAM